ncbi:MAG TPA: N-acetylglucosamine-specific PTS transporter subunit IIBC [Woeseiaceae bacterium]|nr:N-acetylglucosamine-specific PTS transporter subunit IIBC [Woeseiaceae bacterium]
MTSLFAGLQKLGRALMLPIAVLPVAGLLLRLGQPDLLDWPMVSAAGAAIFSHLGLLFAVGIGVGLARENHGAAGLAALVGYFVATEGAAALMSVPAEVLQGLAGEALEPARQAWIDARLAKLSVPAGILSGVAAGWLYNRYADIRLPDYLAFFGGRRFVPIASGILGLALATAFGFGWPLLEGGMDAASRAVLGTGEAGLFLYGALNRVLIVTGLHHILNNIAWFLLGDFGDVTGDLRRFFAGDPAAGAFMSGFFPVMMFGLPAACLAMYHAAPKGRRTAVGGLLFSMALTSFLTGVTEPIEYTFMFLAPALYAVHALLTGVSMVLMDALGVRLGFGFSAGLFDYMLNYRLATRPLWLLPVGLAYSLVYYAMFRWCIRRFALPTPGREPETAAAAGAARVPGDVEALVAALGGPANLLTVDACTTRLRLTVADAGRVCEDALRQAGAHGVIRPSAGAVQVVLGPAADRVAGDIRRLLAGGGGEREPAPAGPEPAVARGGTSPATGAEKDAAGAWLAALGGATNLRHVESCAGRVRVEVAERARARLDDPLPALRAAVWVAPRVAHLLVDQKTLDVARATRALAAAAAR